MLDNHSTDDTRNVVLNYSKHSNLKLVTNVLNIGGNANILRAIEYATKLFNCKYTTLKNIIRKQKKSEILDNQQPSLYTSIYKDVEEGSTTKFRQSS